MNQTNQLITVIIPTRNGNTTIARAIRSVLKQTYPNIEILIISDHLQMNEKDRANDELLRTTIREAFPKELEDGKIRIINGQARGPGIARNLGVASASADSQFIAFLDDDDIWVDDDKLIRQMHTLEQFPALYVTGCETTFFITEKADDQTGKTNRFKTVLQPTDPASVYRQMLVRNPIITSSVLMRKKPFQDFGGFKEMYLAEDYDLWLRMNRLSRSDRKAGLYRIANTPDTHIEYTVRSGSASQKKWWNMAWTVGYLVLIKNFWFYPNKFGIIKSKTPVVMRFIGRIFGRKAI